jgi:hypothetical protein
MNNFVPNTKLSRVEQMSLLLETSSKCLMISLSRRIASCLLQKKLASYLMMVAVLFQLTLLMENAT